MYHHRKPIKECLSVALEDPKCLGFNTVGFFKDKIDNLTISPFFSKDTDGIYVKKSHVANLGL